MTKPIAASAAIVRDLYALRKKLLATLAQVDRDIEACIRQPVYYTVNTRPSSFEGYSVAYTTESDQQALPADEEVKCQTQSKS